MKLITKIFFILCIALMTNKAYAATLNSFEIIPSKNNFDIILNSEEKIKIKEKIYKDKIVYTLKNTKPAKNIKIDYNKSKLDNVIIKTDKNDTKIILKSYKITPPTKTNNFGYYLLGLTIVGMLFNKLISKEKEEPLPVMVMKDNHNFDYLLQYKLKQKKLKVDKSEKYIAA